MKANIKTELREQSATKLSRSEMNKWGPLTPGEWVVVAFLVFAVAMFYGDVKADDVLSQSDVVQQGEAVEVR